MVSLSILYLVCDWGPTGLFNSVLSGCPLKDFHFQSHRRRPSEVWGSSGLYFLFLFDNIRYAGYGFTEESRLILLDVFKMPF